MSSFIEFVLGHDRSVSTWMLGIALKVAIILAVAAFVCRLLWSHSAAVRHRVWMTSLMASLLIPLSVEVMPPVNVFSLPDMLFQAGATREPVAAHRDETVFPSRDAATVTLPASSESQEVIGETSQRDIAMTTHEAASEVSQSAAMLPREGSLSLRQNLAISNTRLILPGVWAVGCCVLAGSFLWALCLQFLRHRRLRMVVGDEWLASVAEQSRRLGLRRTVRTFASTRGVVPAVYGVFRAYLVVPADWRTWSDEQRTCILLHELAHIKRRDLTAQFVARLAVMMYWFNPLVWYAIKQLRLERELACDDCVLMVGQRPSDYAEQLLRTLKSYRIDRVTLGVAMAHSARLDQRILAILDETRSRLPMNARTVAISLVVALAMTAGLGAAAFTTTAAGAQSTNSVTDQEAEDPDFTALFNGYVSGPDGKPFEGAEIFVVPVNASPDFLEPIRLRAVTGADGRFEFEALDMTVVDLDGFRTRIQCTVLARADGYGPDWRRVSGGWRSWSLGGLIKGTNLSLQLVKDDVPIRGRLLGPDGQPLADARVRLHELMIPKQEDLDVQLKREVEVRQNPFGSLVGSMGYERSLSGPNLEAMRVTEVQTDSDGQFMMTGLGSERLVRLSVSAKPIVNTELMVVTREMPDLSLETDPSDPDPDRDMSREVRGTIRGATFTVTLPRGLTVSGQVIDRDTRKPIPGMQIGTRDMRMDDLVNGRVHPIVTDRDGRFTLTGLDPRVLTFREEHRRVAAVSRPGQFYGSNSGAIDADGQVLIECSRGIPFHLKVVDEEGSPVDAIVRTIIVTPNNKIDRTRYQSGGIINRAARKPDGSYEGFVLPGPGAILVKTPPGAGYRPAHVSPKGEFAPGRTKWTAQEEISAFGTHDTVMGPGVWYNQHDYSAIVLTNAEPGASRLELVATVIKNRSRRITIVDPDHNPITGVKTRGLTFHPWDAEPSLRSASFVINGLHPDRRQRIQFFLEERQLVGFLVARGDDDSPYTVRMLPWGTVTGRLVDEDGTPIGGASLTSGSSGTVTNPDDTKGDNVGTKSDTDGRFQINRLIPGLSYTVRVYPRRGHLLGTAFEKLVIKPGETRDLGDISPGR
tara:strand:- start:73967 stop:77242 length:3276 start_codon:yes stop_codon:yes gene_type:complete